MAPLKDCFNTDIIFRRSSFLLSMKSEKWEDEREALGFMRDGRCDISQFFFLHRLNDDGF